MLQSPNPQTWTTTVYSYVFGLFTALTLYLIKEYRDRKKSSLENEETTARTEMTRASTQSTILRDNIAVGESIGKLLTDLIEAGDTIQRLQERVFELEQENIRFRITRISLKKAKALLDYHSIPFSEADEPEIKRLVERRD